MNDNLDFNSDNRDPMFDSANKPLCDDARADNAANMGDYYNTSAKPRQPKKKHRAFAAIAKGFLAVALVAAISAGSVGGYIWYKERNDTSAQSGYKSPTSDINQVYYKLGETKDALSTPQIYQKTVPSVVAFTCKIPVESNAYFGFGFPGIQQGNMTTTATGTGIVMTADGYIMTNEHVVSDATEITVTLYDGKEYKAKVVGADANTDIAVVKIDAKGLTPAEYGDSTSLLVGEAAIVIGNPLGLDFADTLTQGVISSTERQVKLGSYIMTLIQTDAAISPGNSGGPLLNSRGQVVGVVNSKISQEKVEGIGFAIPSDVALSIAQDLIKHGAVTTRPVLGITVQTITEEQAAAAGLEAGLTVQDVIEGSCADLAGIKTGDKITAFNNVKVKTANELNFQKEKCKVGDEATMTIIRDGKEQTITIKLLSGTIS